MSMYDLDKWAEDMAEQITDKILGVNYDNILELLEAKSKRDAKRIGHALTISRDQFSSMVLNILIYHTHGYSYASYFKTHMATDLTEDRLEQYTKNRDIGKIIQKTFIERKHNCFHLFERKDEWHLFYFNFSDVEGDHWKKGEHIHYISYLWGIDKSDLLKQVGDRRYKIDGIHIKTSFE